MTMSSPSPPQTSDGSTDQRANLHQLIQGYYRLAPVTVPLFAILLALIVAGFVIAATGANPLEAYEALFRGMFGSGDAFAQSLARSTPYIAASLAVAFAFRAGLFNIGAEGQLLVGATAAAWVGTWSQVQGWPGPASILLVIVAGVVGGGIWGFVPGVLKARTGAHEVIVTIMLNNIAARVVLWLISSRDPEILILPEASAPRTADISDNARLPKLVDGTDLSVALLIAVFLCGVVWVVLNRMRFGFEVQTVGANPHAARYAGMSVATTVVVVMAISGALAGAAGAAELSGKEGFLRPGAFENIGFDSIGIALLARANPWAIIPAALLWGALLSGGPAMQLEAGISLNVVRIIQALVLLFVAADAIVRYVFRIRAAEGSRALRAKQHASGWGAA